MLEAVSRHPEFLLGSVDRDHRLLFDLAEDQSAEKPESDYKVATDYTLDENRRPVLQADQCLEFLQCNHHSIRVCMQGHRPQ